MSSERVKLYAISLFEVGKEQGNIDVIEEEIGVLRDLLTDDRSLILFLSAPLVPQKVKDSFVDKVFSGKLSDVVIRFLKLAIAEGYQQSMGEILEALVEKIDEANKRQRITVKSSTALDDGILGKLTDVFRKKYNKEILLKNEVDKSILGGIIVRVGDLIIDGSLIKDLRNMRSNLIQSKFRGVAVYED